MSRARVYAVAALCLGLALGARAAGAVAFPVQPSGNGRYLVDQGGAAFFMVGDAAQSAAGALTLAQFQSYVDTRVGQGFNTINVNFIEHKYAPAPPADRSGNQPFTTAGDFSTPNDAYYAELEQKVAYAQSKGVLVSLALYLGGGSHSEGWYAELTSAANTQAVCNGFGQYLANGRGAFGGLKKYANVMWTWGADWHFTTDTEARDRLHQIAQGLKDAGSTQLMLGDWGIPGTGQGLGTIQDGFQTYMDLESVYAYTNSGGIVETARAGYGYEPSTAAGDGRSLTALPVYMKETGYEGEANPSGTPAAVRGYGWTAILNGCTAGYWYGHRDVWDFAFATPSYGGAGLFPPYSPWTTSVTSSGAQDMARLAALLGTLGWQKLVPSGTAAPFIGRTLVPGNDTAAGGAISAAQASDGTLLLAYVPSTGTGTQSFTVDTRSMSAAAQARWWDPTSAVFSAAGSLSNTATHLLTTPGTNAAGANDWLLVVDTGGPPAVSIAPPSAIVSPRGTASFTASGGSGTGYVWSLSVNASGGSIGPSGGYIAGSTDNVTDTVKVVDSLGNFATASVAVSTHTAVSIAPVDASVADGETIAFTASGGSGSGWVWALAVNGSGGSVTSAGIYTAGHRGNTTDTVRVTDSLGNAADATVTVRAGAGVVKGSCSSAGGGVEWMFPLLVAAVWLRRRGTRVPPQGDHALRRRPARRPDRFRYQ
jgi:Protein of unknown function (DUF4038)/Putative collagen-binding domain of a collagenase